MRNPSYLRSYQIRAIHHCIDHPNAMVWAGVGLGKTVIGETTVADLIDRGEITGALVVGTKRIVQSVWRQEAKEWSHLRHLTFSLIHGPAEKRHLALRKYADIYLVNYENLSWLVTTVMTDYLRKGRYPPFNLLIYDEVARMKNATAKRSQAMRQIEPYFCRRIGLTGEPAANGYKDLYGQFLAIDGGQRLGTSKTAFQDAFLSPDGERGWRITSVGRNAIHRRISDITLELNTDDYLELPPLVENDLWVDLPPKARSLYDQMEKEFFAELDQGVIVESPTEAAKSLRCLQIAAGALYEAAGSKSWQEVHNAKLDALEDLLEEQGEEPVLLGYGYQHDRDRILERFPQARVLSASLSEKESQALIDSWNRGEIPLMIGHPASMGEGLNIQYGGHTLCWFGLNWSLYLYNQFNGRLAGGLRRRNRVTMNRILARDTLDEVVRDTLIAKDSTQKGLRAAINDYRQRRGL